MDLNLLLAQAKAQVVAAPLADLRPICLREPHGWTLWLYQGDQLVMVVERDIEAETLTGVHVGNDDVLDLLDKLVTTERLTAWLEAMAAGAADGATAMVAACGQNQLIS